MSDKAELFADFFTAFCCHEYNCLTCNAKRTAVISEFISFYEAVSFKGFKLVVEVDAHAEQSLLLFITNVFYWILEQSRKSSAQEWYRRLTGLQIRQSYFQLLNCFQIFSDIGSESAQRHSYLCYRTCKRGPETCRGLEFLFKFTHRASSQPPSDMQNMATFQYVESTRASTR